MQASIKKGNRIVGLSAIQISAAIQKAMLYLDDDLCTKKYTGLLDVFSGCGGIQISAQPSATKRKYSIVEYCIESIQEAVDAPDSQLTEFRHQEILDSVSAINEEYEELKSENKQLKEALTDVTQALLDVIGSTREVVHFSGDFIPINFRIEMYKAIGHRVYLIEDPGELANFALSMLSQEEQANPYRSNAMTS